MDFNKLNGMFECCNRLDVPFVFMRKIEMQGLSFGRLLVNHQIPSRNGKVFWLCNCICGKSTNVSTTDLRSGHTKSCGCLSKEIAKERQTTHGKRYIPEYRTWCKMKERCYNKADINYHYYGERGIKICDRWIQSFQFFYDDMGNRPTPLHSIDRLDNNGNYEPSNCRWATPIEQCRNRRSSRVLEYNGVSKTLIEWANELNVSSANILKHLSNGRLFDEIASHYRYKKENNLTSLKWKPFR